MRKGKFKQLCSKSWEEEYNYLSVDRFKKRDEGRFCIYNESKTTYTGGTLRRKPFQD